MITLEQFWNGRDRAFAKDLTATVRLNAVETLYRANRLLTEFKIQRPESTCERLCNSGWRPLSVNVATTGAARLSRHLTGEAIDISDRDGNLDAWCLTEAGQEALERLKLWLECPTATPGWCHVQTVPPKSGNRVFRP